MEVIFVWGNWVWNFWIMRGMEDMEEMEDMGLEF